ncbi:MAG: hypothetical protein ACRD2U_04350 [Terriglobales bacterium]
MCQRLAERNTQEAEEGISRSILRRIEDPLRPRGQNGRFRVNPFLLLLALLGVLAMATFLFFNFSQL